MHQPPQVQARAQRADQLIQELNGTAEVPEQTPATPPAPPEAAPPAPDQTPAAPPEHPTEQPPAPAAPEPKEPLPPEEQLARAENRYRSLQGVLNATNARLNAKIDSLTEENTRLRGEIEQARKAPAPAPTPAPVTPDVDEETYGPELSAYIDRRAAKLADQRIEEHLKKLQPDLEQTRSSVEHVAKRVYQNDTERFLGELGKLVPDFQDVNNRADWLDWLQELDPMARVPRQSFLDEAQRNLDHAHAAQLFNAFKTQAGLNAPAPQRVTPQHQPSPSPRTVGTASAPVPREPSAAKVTRDEIKNHYQQVGSRPGYRGSKEYSDFEARMKEAMAAGNVV